MKRYEQIMGVLLVLTFVWVVALWAYIANLPADPPTIEHAPITIRRAPESVMVTPRAGPLSPYVGSRRTDSHVYHARGCTEYHIKDAKPYWSVAEAEADGRRPALCSCLTPQIARAP